MRVLLIGNGPAALSREIGGEIDAFPGYIGRFNNYTTKGFERWVGSRTDLWFTTDCHTPQALRHKNRYVVCQNVSDRYIKLANNLNATVIPQNIVNLTNNRAKKGHMSSGAIATTFLLENGHSVFLYGFDFLNKRNKHHYNNDNQVRGDWHDDMYEWYFFHELSDSRKIQWFGKSEYESFPIVRTPAKCGKPDDPTWYRMDAHKGWYEWMGKTFCSGMEVLDVGCGMGTGVKQLSKYAKSVSGQDVGEELRDLVPDIILNDISEIPSKSYDIVTACEVIEHVVEDIKFFNHLKRIARHGILTTTPNFYRSKCANGAHCREYTIAEFANQFKPLEVWTGSPDGSVHITKVLERQGQYWVDLSVEGVDNKNKVDSYMCYKYKVPLRTRFNNTVDGEEWPSIVGVWRF